MKPSGNRNRLLDLFGRSPENTPLLPRPGRSSLAQRTAQAKAWGRRTLDQLTHWRPGRAVPVHINAAEPDPGDRGEELVVVHVRHSAEPMGINSLPAVAVQAPIAVEHAPAPTLVPAPEGFDPRKHWLETARDSFGDRGLSRQNVLIADQVAKRPYLLVHPLLVGSDKTANKLRERAISYYWADTMTGAEDPDIRDDGFNDLEDVRHKVIAMGHNPDQVLKFEAVAELPV